MDRERLETEDKVDAEEDLPIRGVYKFLNKWRFVSHERAAAAAAALMKANLTRSSVFLLRCLLLLFLHYER